MANPDDESELGEALRRAFDDLIPDIEPSERLKSNVSAFGSGGPRWHRRTRFGPSRVTVGFAAVISAAVAAVLTFGQASVAPSFAVMVEANRSVRVTLYELKGAKGANARLDALHVRARIVPMRADCPTRMALTSLPIREHPAPTIHLIPREIPAGTTVVLAARRTGRNQVEMVVGRVTGGAPSCVRLIAHAGLSGIQH